ncbi:unnamed protein product [Calypogeia fissa]
MSKPTKRRETDIMKLMMSDYKVETVNDRLDEILVEFRGPKGSPYQGGTWKVRVRMPKDYPFKYPSINFVNKIYHPNIDEKTGNICLDVLYEKWSPMYDLINVFEVFLPQLLLYPNPASYRNQGAAVLMMNDYGKFEQEVTEHCKTHAAAGDGGAEAGAENVEASSLEEELSSDEVGSDDDSTSN